jgi:uncharacterized protein (DUF1800 family)
MAFSQIDWSPKAAAHLLRRVAFGGTPEEVERLYDLGPEQAVDRLLSFSFLPEDLPPPATDPREAERRREMQRARRQNLEMSRKEAADFQRSMREVLAEMRFWWLQRMRDDRFAANEKLVLFWHGHFATSQTKVRFNHAMLEQNETLRRLAMAPFPELCAAMAKDAAMLIWLDGRQSTKKAPNENFAREVMELFTLGEGYYSEDDVRMAARCFTGWTVKMETGQAQFVPRRFDEGRKKLFGKSGNFNSDEAVAVICGQPRCAEFLATKLWEFYAYPQPAPSLVKSLADHYRANGMSTRQLLPIIFTHPEFYSDRALASQIKSPVQWLVQSARELSRQVLTPGSAVPLLAELGQNLFEPPSVKGWDGGRSWINSGTLIRRSNSALLLTTAAPPLPDADSPEQAAWLRVVPDESRADSSSLIRRLEKTLLCVSSSTETRRRLEVYLATRRFPCDDETVRAAAVILVGSPEYNLC